MRGWRRVICFGNDAKVQSTTSGNTSTGTTGQTSSGTTGQVSGGTTNSTTAMPAWLTAAAQGNVNSAQALQGQGFTPYTGQQVAGFSPEQSASFGLGSDIAGGISPYVGQTGSLISNYANAGPQHVSADSIYSNMSPYMNQYVSQALAPQIEAQNQQFAGQNKAFDASATGAGAFGDTGWGLGRSNLTQQQDTARTGLIGNAYTNAFNTAIGAGAQDVSNRLNASNTNAGLAEAALGRQLTGANALTQSGTNAANLTNTQGQQQTAQQQAQLNAAYNQWIMAQQAPYLQSQNLNAAINTAKGVSPVTQTGATTGQQAGTTSGTNAGNYTGATTGTSQTNAPDNSGYGILGSLGSAAIGAFLADGGPALAGKPAIVGERGPELIVPNANSLVIPNEILEAARKLREKKLKDAPTIKFGIAA